MQTISPVNVDIEKLKLCNDCVFCKNQKNSAIRFSKCVHPNSLDVAEVLVTGDFSDLNNYSYCSTNRKEYGVCKPQGHLFKKNNENTILSLEEYKILNTFKPNPVKKKVTDKILNIFKHK